MLKNFAFGILAAAIAIAPGAAFVGQSQSNVQVTTQEGAAINGSTNAQKLHQQQPPTTNSKRTEKAGYRGSYYKPRYPKANTNQSQGSVQRTSQSGAAIDGSVNAQDSVTRNNQNQSVRGR